MTKTFLEEVGGKPVVERVHTIFYDKLLIHPWLKDFFVGMERWHLEEQQTDFMMVLFGGPPHYSGRAPMRAHQHLFITDEVFEIRHELLSQSLDEANVSEEHKQRWLKFDAGMKSAVVKKSVDEVEPLYRTGPVIIVPKPEGLP